MTDPCRIVFMGTAPLAAVILRALHASRRDDIVAVVTQPDRPKGRDLKLQPSAVKAAALELGLPVHQPDKARDPQFIAQLRTLAPGVIVVAAYGQILPRAILDIPPRGCLNIHTSILPKHRGAAPIQWAIASGETETGVTLMKMDEGMDTGDIIAIRKTPIAPDDTSATLHDRLATLGAELLVETLPDWMAGKASPTPQPHADATHARKITKDDGRINWTHGAQEIVNRLRAFTPWPGAFTTLPGVDRNPILKVLRAEAGDGAIPLAKPGEIISTDAEAITVACGAGTLRLLEIQREGGRPMAVREFLAGCSLQIGQRFPAV